MTSGNRIVKYIVKNERKIMFSKRTNQWNVPYNVYNPVAEKRQDMRNDAEIYKRWRKEQNQKKNERKENEQN